MKTLIQAIAVTGAITGAIAAPAGAQDAASDAGALLDALTCREFLALGASEQMTVMLAMRAHVTGDELPDEPLPIGLEAEVGGADSLGGDSGDASAEGLEAGADGATAADEAMGDETAEAAADAPSREAQAPGDGEVLVDEEVVEGEVEGGRVNADGTEASVTDAPADPKLTAMRTSCEGGPDALATDAMLAAHADYE